jgi:tetratricopeptide (TPR) repeat protein
MRWGGVNRISARLLCFTGSLSAYAEPSWRNPPPTSFPSQGIFHENRGLVALLVIILLACAIARYWPKKTTQLPVPLRASSTASSPQQVSAAQAALKLASSLIFESDAPYRALEDPVAATTVEQSATLAARQIAIAEANDPYASITLEDGRRFTLSDLKALSLHLEGIAVFAKKPKKGLAILEQAIALKPSLADFHFSYGVLGMQYDRRKALHALSEAVALAPENMDYQKTLLRAQNVSRGELLIAGGFKVARRAYTTAKFIQNAIELGLITGALFSFYFQIWIGVFGCVVCLVAIQLAITGKDKAKEKVAEWMTK